jgi:hypothetical protein
MIVYNQPNNNQVLIMKDSVTLLDTIRDSFTGFITQLVEYSPRILAAIILLLAGWFMARVIKLLVIRLIESIDRLWQKLMIGWGMSIMPSRRPPAKFIAQLFYWMIILLSVALASDVLGLGIFVNWLSEIVKYIPVLISGLLIILVGYIVSSLARDLIQSAMSSAGLSQGDIIGRSAQIVILFTAIVIGVDQIGIDVSFLSIIAAVILGAMLGGVAIAFGLGARTHVANLIASHHISQQLKPGDRIRIREITGNIIEVTATQVLVETEEGRLYVPAAHFNQESILLMEKE